MNDHVRPCNLKPQQRDLTPVLRRPVEPATEKRTSNVRRLGSAFTQSRNWQTVVPWRGGRAFAPRGFSGFRLCENRSFHRLQQLPRFTQQGLNLLALGDRVPREQAVPARVLVCPWCAGSRRTAGERHDPPERIFAPQRELASIGLILRARSLMPVLPAWRPGNCASNPAPVRHDQASRPSGHPSPRAPGDCPRRSRSHAA